MNANTAEDMKIPTSVGGSELGSQYHTAPAQWEGLLQKWSVKEHLRKRANAMRYEATRLESFAKSLLDNLSGDVENLILQKF